MKLTPTRSFVFCCCCGALFAFILISPSYTRYTDYNGGYGNNNNGNSGGGGYNNGGNGRNGNGPRGGGGMGKGILHILPMHIYMQHLVYISKKKTQKTYCDSKKYSQCHWFYFFFRFFLALSRTKFPAIFRSPFFLNWHDHFLRFTQKKNYHHKTNTHNLYKQPKTTNTRFKNNDV